MKDALVMLNEDLNAEESFMKAVEINSEFTISREKALKAKHMNDSLMVETEEGEKI